MDIVCYCQASTMRNAQVCSARDTHSCRMRSPDTHAMYSIRMNISHTMLAGQGIEYDFGRCKWWFRKHNRHSAASLRETSAAAFGKDVVSLWRTRRFARKCRDYMRVYRAGKKGLDTDSSVTILKTHRCALDTHTSFIISDDIN